MGMSVCTFFVNAQTQTEQNATTEAVATTTEDDHKKTEIKPEELPENTRTSLEGVRIVKAYRLTDKDGHISGYEVVINKSEGESTLWFDKDGNSKNM